MTDIVIIAVVAVIIGAAAWYVYRAKKRGVKCIGCPDGCSCPSKNGQACCGCNCGSVSSED